MHIARADGVTEELYEALRRLVPQLGGHAIPPTRAALAALIDSESSILLVAHEPDERSAIAGVLTLTIYRVPTGIRSIVEDLVVDERMRRRGIAEALLRRAIDIAREAGAQGVSLTSNPRREAASRLYLAMGFRRRNTNAYFYELM